MNKMNIMEYKGYWTKIEYSVPDRVLYGKIEGIRDLVNFEAETPEDVEKEFHLAVDDYLASCQDAGDEPNKPFRGVFNVRIPPEMHREAAIVAAQRDITLNAFVVEAIRSALQGRNTDMESTVMFVPIPGLSKKEFEPAGKVQYRGAIEYGN